MKTLIDYDEKTGVFHLHNDAISYVMQIVEHGVLTHLYFGQRISHYHGGLANPRRDRGFSGNFPGTTDRTFSLDSLLQEFSSNGDGDFRNVASIIRQADGSRAANFVYQDYEILEGKPSLKGLPAAYVDSVNEAQTLNLYLKDQVSQLIVKLSYTIYRNRNVIARAVQLINDSSQTVHIEKLASMQLDLPASNNKEVISLPGAHVNERHMEREKLHLGTKVYQSRRGTTSHQMNNFIVICDDTTTENQGEAIGLSLVYSGNHKEEIEKDQYGTYRIISGINDDQFDWELKPGQNFQTPEVLLSYSHQGLNHLSQTLHQLLRDRVARGNYKNRPRPILVNNWEATFFDFDEAKLKTIVDDARDLGIEMFVLDDGWFGHRDNDSSSLGDWQVYKKKFPPRADPFCQLRSPARP